MRFRHVRGHGIFPPSHFGDLHGTSNSPLHVGQSFAEIGQEHGPFDLTLVQIGAYGDAWPDIHMIPEDGVATHLDVRGGLMIPISAIWLIE